VVDIVVGLILKAPHPKCKMVTPPLISDSIVQILEFTYKKISHREDCYSCAWMIPCNHPTQLSHTQERRGVQAHTNHRTTTLSVV
jgi:hypothetical protein